MPLWTHELRGFASLPTTRPDRLSFVPSINLREATVWLPHQTIIASVIGLDDKQIIIHVNDSSFLLRLRINAFHLIALVEMKTSIWVEGKAKDTSVKSETLVF